MDIKKESLELHEKLKGKFEIKSKIPLKDKSDLSLAYTPGVAEPCLKIKENKEDSYKYTSRGNIVAVISDGSAVLGLGNIGPEAGMPVMEGKAVIFKEFGGVDAIPLVIGTQETDEIIQIVKNLEPSFGGINLEDISAPRCFEVEEKLIKEMNIPVFHDDQHGTAIAVLAGLINALKIVNKKEDEIKIVVNGAGAAGIAITKLLLSYGFKNVIVLDSKEAIYSERDGLNKYKKELAKVTNLEKENGRLENVLNNADVLIGVSAPNIVTKEMIQLMNNDAIVFVMSNPIPEIMPDLAKEAGARIVATGRSDFPNQINNALVFPGFFRGLLDSRAKQVTQEMKIEAAKALANMVGKDELKEDFIIPSIFNKEVHKAVSEAVMRVAKSKPQ